MKFGIQTCENPTDPEQLYVRCMFHTFFYGPFKDEEAVVQALKTLDKADEYWDYDCFCIVYGANPLPKDYVGGFPFVDHEMRERIEKARRQS